MEKTDFGFEQVPRGEKARRVHAVFASDALRVLEEAGAGRVVTCNTLPHESNAVDVLGDVAQAVQHILPVRT